MPIWVAWSEAAFFERLLAPGAADRSAAAAHGLRAIDQRIGATVAQLSMAWVLVQRGVDSAIAGSRGGRHMHENAGAAALDLGDVTAELNARIPLGPTFTSLSDAARHAARLRSEVNELRPRSRRRNEISAWPTRPNRRPNRSLASHPG